jgi:hypothetical protein
LVQALALSHVVEKHVGGQFSKEGDGHGSVALELQRHEGLSASLKHESGTWFAMLGKRFWASAPAAIKARAFIIIMLEI